MRRLVFWSLCFFAVPLLAAEHSFNFGECPLDQTPPGFRSTVTGRGKPGSWKTVLDDTPSQFPPLTTNGPSMTKRQVLAQLARDPADEHFPLLVYENDTYADFTFTTRFKFEGGAIAQMAGIVFRYQDEKNYYVLLASGLDERFWFFKVVNGQPGPRYGPKVTIPKGEWHELSVECDGNRIHCRLDGKEIIPMLTDNSFLHGKVGFWTKSDSISYFADARVVYTPREILAQTVVNETLKKNPKLVGLKIYALRPGNPIPVVVGSKDEAEAGQAGTETHQDVIRNGKSYFSRDKRTATVTSALRDRNGEPIAAVHITVKTFPGETQDIIVGKTQSVMQAIQARVQSLEDLLQ
jgi:hypothetical protein